MTTPRAVDEGGLVADIDAERSLLGACMESAAAVEQAAEILAGPLDFVRGAHQVIFRALLELTFAGESTDPVRVKSALIERGQIGELGERGPAYLLDVYQWSMSAGSVATHATTVAKHAVRRRAIESTVRALQKLNNPTYETDEALAGFEAELDAIRRDRTGAPAEPDFERLDAFLDVEDPPVQYRVSRLMPIGARVMASAQFKAGKTTLRDNLVRALADKEDFLGSFEVEPVQGQIVIIDNELDKSMLRRWLREQGIVNAERVSVLSLRGKVGTFDLLDPATRARWARKLKAIDAKVVIFDCLRPVLDALKLSEDKEAGRFLVAFDALLDEAGASEAVLIHHMGHTAERSRGDSRLQDWPDVTWRLVRERGEDGETEPDARRYFSAYGRDVEVPEGLLTYDRDARRLTLTGGNRRETAADSIIPEIVDHVAANPGTSGRAIEKAMVEDRGHKQKDVRAALRRAVAAGELDTADGPRRAVLHFLPTPEDVSASSASAVRQRGQSECVSASIRRTHSLTRDGPSASQRTEPGPEAA